MKNYQKIFIILVIALQMFNFGCIQEKLVEKPPLNSGPEQYERWSCSVRAPVGNWKYRIALNPRLVGSNWVAKEATITDSSNPLLYPEKFTVSSSLNAPATGEVLLYGTKDFAFYTNDSWVGSLLEKGEDLDSASLLIEPDNYKMNIHNFTNQMVVRFFYYADDDRTPINETIVALVGTFNNWGAGGERSRMELKDDGVFPDKTAGDHIWTIEIPLESTFTYKYKFLVDAQWDSANGKWDSSTGTFVPDYANPDNTYENWKGDSYITVR